MPFPDRLPAFRQGTWRVCAVTQLKPNRFRTGRRQVPRRPEPCCAESAIREVAKPSHIIFPPISYHNNPNPTTAPSNNPNPTPHYNCRRRHPQRTQHRYPTPSPHFQPQRNPTIFGKCGHKIKMTIKFPPHSSTSYLRGGLPGAGLHHLTCAAQVQKRTPGKWRELARDNAGTKPKKARNAAKEVRKIILLFEKICVMPESGSQKVISRGRGGALPPR